MAEPTAAVKAAVPDLIDLLAGYGLARDRFIAECEKLAEKFPKDANGNPVLGEMFRKQVYALAQAYLTNEVLSNVLAKVSQEVVGLFQTGKSKVKRNRASMA